MTDDHTLVTPRKNGLIAFLLLIALNCVILWYGMLSRFDPNDYGGFIDVAWRILNGQRMYLDFQWYVGPYYPLAMAFYMKLLGVTKAAFGAHLIVHSTAALTLVYLTFRHHMRTSLLILICVLSMVGYNWSFPFANFNTESYIWALLGAYLLLNHFPAKKTATDCFCFFFALGFAASMALMTKYSVGGPLGLIFFAALFHLKQNKMTAFFGYLTGCWCVFLITFYIVKDPVAFYEQTLAFYSSNRASRTGIMLQLKTWLWQQYWVPILITGLTVLIFKLKRHYLPLLLGIGFYAMSIFNYSAGSMRDYTFMPLSGFCAAIAFLTLEKIYRSDKKSARLFSRIASIILIGIILVQIFICGKWMHDILRAKQIHHHYGNYAGYTLKDTAFKGWRIFEIWGGAIDEFAPYIEENIPEDESLLIVTKLQILYALTQRESYPGITFQFNYNDQPAPGPQVEIVRNNILNNPPDWILTHADAGPYKINIELGYIGLDDYVRENYRVIKTWKNLGLFRRVTPK